MAKSREKLTPVPRPAKRTGRNGKAPSAEEPPSLEHIAPSLRSLAVPLDGIAFLAGNPVKHPEKQIEELRASLRQFGQVEPLVINTRTTPPTVIGGNGRLAGMLAEGWTHAAVVELDLDTARANALAVTLNRTTEGREWDKEALDAILREVATGNEERLDQMLSELATDMGIVPADASPNGAVLETEEEDYWHDEDGLDLLFKAPYPWFGGKARVAKLVWSRFGDVPGYVEPFFGSGAVLLNRPLPLPQGVETINDFDGLVCNFWRAVKADPKAVAEYADWPCLENDLAARHLWLVERKDTLQARLEGDPDYFDAKVAGYWVWGMSLWIGSGFCSGEGPWRAVEAEDGSRQLVHLGDAGRGVHRQLVHLGDAGRGVHRQLVHLGNTGRGVHRQLVHLGNTGQEAKAGLGECGLLAWMEALSERLRRVRVCCGDWTRVCGGNSGDALQHFFAAGEPCGTFLDPPYPASANREEGLYRKDDLEIAHAVCDWAVAHGDDKRLRIALAGYEGQHDMPSSWERVRWKAPGGMAGVARGESQAKANRFREVVWFSPHCLQPAAG